MCDIIEVTDLDAPELDVYARLTQAQLRSRREPEKGIFIAESPKVIGHALDAGCVPLSLLMERRQLEGQGRDLVERCGQVPVYTGDRAVLAGLTGYELTRGILCAMRRPRLPSVEELCARASRVAVLEGIVDPTNVGAIFRSAAALHMDGVLVTPTCCDPLHRRAVRVSMGTVFQIPWTYLGEDPAHWPHPGLERLRELGDILTSNLHAMERGMEVLRAVDFYDPEGREIDVPLDPLLTPQQNAAKYYKDYNKAKIAESILTLQLEKGRRDLDYLNSVLEAIALAEGERDLQEIRQELTDTGYLRRPSKAKGREKRISSKPMEFRSSAGLRISVGKNNTQNDLLTTKQAFKSDLWFHTQKIHGSHVILWLEGGEADAQSLTEAAILAATFSQAGEGSRVPVDYTPVKYVKKPAGARPGMVVYTTYQTAVVDPDPELAKQLRVK